MQGYYVPRRFGWDCHGLPVENEIEKTKELSGASSIEDFGIAAFNEECRAIVLRYTSQWEETVNRMGRWVSFENVYRTMDLPFMESVWWVFGKLYEMGLVYEGFKVMPFSAKLGTPLSNFEANLNYKEVDDPSLTISFKLDGEENTFILVWTTTPWTLPSNLAILVQGDAEYVKVKEKSSGRVYILAGSRLKQTFKEDSLYEVIGAVKGRDLLGKKYEPLFPYFKDLKEKGAFRVIEEVSVSLEEGTGFVHAAPAFGEVDFYACLKEKIDPVCPVDQNGYFTKEVPDFQGVFVKDADKEIIRRLKSEGKVFHAGQIHHRYPFCWRSDTPLIYKAVRTWFVSVERIKERLLIANQKIHWTPEHIKEGRFGKWLENARDWSISRNRYWGTPIPLWRSEEGDLKVITSVKELEEKVGQKVSDLHRHFIDQLTFEENGKVYKRVSEVFDCWFESGSMPYAQDHYPFENKEGWEKKFPADFIAEGIDQTRGWFYTLHVLATALYDQPAFKNVIVNGIILAEDGTKMSKRLKNYPEPSFVINKYGADAIRLYLLSSPAVKAEDLRFSERGVELILRQVLIPFWNSFVFLSTYAKIYAWNPEKSAFKQPSAQIDQWILSLLQRLIASVEEAMEGYDLNSATLPFTAFIDQLTNWYIRRNRSRFWADEESSDRREAFETLYTVLKTLSKLAAPFIPFMSESIYQELKVVGDPESVHLCDFPKVDARQRMHTCEKEMEDVQKVVSLGHSLRKEHKLKVRQPLARAHLITANKAMTEALQRKLQLIADELNVKEVEILSDETAFVSLIAVPNFRVLGKKVGALMPAVKERTQNFSQTELKTLLEGNALSLSIGGQEIVLTPEDVAVERRVKAGVIAATEGEVTVALDTELTEELLMEGLAREMINKINAMRRDAGFEVTDRIKIALKPTLKIKVMLEKFHDLIAHEVLAKEILLECKGGMPWDLNGEMTQIVIAKV
jgi:isoleucyl-tRNA synthetase